MKFEPTDELRAKVKSLVGFGVPQQQICALIGIQSMKTLRKYFRAELARGEVEALAKVQQTAFRLATSGRNPRMTMQWLERRAKWAPGMRSRPQLGEAQHYKFIVEEYQPPLADDDPRRNPDWANLIRDLKPTAWDGDDPGGNEDEDDRSSRATR